MPEHERDNDLVTYLLSNPMEMREFIERHEQEMRSPLRRARWWFYQWRAFFKTLLWGRE